MIKVTVKQGINQEIVELNNGAVLRDIQTNPVLQQKLRIQENSSFGVDGVIDVGPQTILQDGSIIVIEPKACGKG